MKEKIERKHLIEPFDNGLDQAKKISDASKASKRPCFRTDERYTCNKPCKWKESCKKLIAVWLRR